MNKPKGPYLDLKQSLSQNLVMNPQMQQAVKILQLSNIELADFLEDMVADNPLLEKDEGPLENEELESTQEAIDSLDDFDEGSYMAAATGTAGSSSFLDATDTFANTVSGEKSLREVLIEQIQTNFTDQRDRMVATLLLDYLDESGYLRDDIETLAEKIGCKPERLEKLLPELKEFEPTGIFAHDLKECLALQLKERGQYNQAFGILLENLDMLAVHDTKKLAGVCNVSEDEIKNMAADIRTLQPKPAGEYDNFVTQTAIPDVLMKKQPREAGGGWRVELNSETLPRVLVNQEYYTTVLSKAGKEDKSYLREKMQAASWLVRSLDQRAQTILKVAAEIIEEQNGFFLYGVEFLRPLTLREIAEKIEMHESTVSRVTTNKFIGTPRGIFELKYFFTSSVPATGGDGDVSSEAVKARIQSLVDAETVNNILSDDAIVTALKDQGVDVARRTVAKYRDALNIPSSVQRRKIKKNLQS